MKQSQTSIGGRSSLIGLNKLQRGKGSVIRENKEKLRFIIDNTNKESLKAVERLVSWKF
jgi:hypothetical protein